VRTYLITGGAGFIGSNYIHYLLAEQDDVRVINLDKLTYAGNLENLADVAEDPRYSFVKGDICDPEVVGECMARGVDVIVNFAAETHVDRSIQDPGSFIETDIKGVHVLLEAARTHGVERFLQISTDEVYGSIAEGSFREEDPLQPNSPYSASKAGAELLVRAYHRTYGVPVLITRSSNNYGPYQYPEKLIPLFITNALDGKPLPLYGDGLNVRDWIHVADNCAALDVVLERGVPGEAYNIGGGNEVPNIEITRAILRLTGRGEELIRHVPDRPGHDRRYSVDCAKLADLGWSPRIPFESGLAATVEWYRRHRGWWERIRERSREYREFYRRQYAALEEEERCES
jgi:dTDP-glucose 4,6-dehydratase